MSEKYKSAEWGEVFIWFVLTWILIMASTAIILDTIHKNP